MAAGAVFESILQQIQSSNLNFKLQLSPFAAEISLKKTPVKNRNGVPYPLPNPLSCTDPVHAKNENTAILTAENNELRNELIKVKQDYAIAVENCERAHEMINILLLKRSQILIMKTLLPNSK